MTITREQAVADAGQVIAQALARQQARTPHEAAVAALGRTATPAHIAAWIARHRPQVAQRSTA
jgi:hypothetical protein